MNLFSRTKDKEPAPVVERRQPAKSAYWEAQAKSARQELMKIADVAMRDVRRLGAHANLMDAALAVLLRHNLMDEFATECSKHEPGKTPAIAQAATETSANVIEQSTAAESLEAIAPEEGRAS